MEFLEYRSLLDELMEEEVTPDDVVKLPEPYKERNLYEEYL